MTKNPKGFRIYKEKNVCAEETRTFFYQVMGSIAVIGISVIAIWQYLA